MKLELRNNRDLLAGTIFIVIGLIAVVVARAYPFGSAMHMGSGYFPTVLGGVLIVLGLAVAARGLALRTKVRGEWGWRPLAMVALGILAFGLLMPRLGLVPALVAAIFASAAGGREFRLKEVLALAAVMSTFAAVVLRYALKLPYPLVAGW